MVSFVSSGEWDRVVLDLSRRPLPIVWRDLVARDTTLLQIEQHRVAFQLAVDSLITERALASSRRRAEPAAASKVFDDDAPPEDRRWERPRPPPPPRPVRPRTAPSDSFFRRGPGEGAVDFRRRLARVVGDTSLDLVPPPPPTVPPRREAAPPESDDDVLEVLTPRRPDEPTLDVLRRLVDSMELPVFEGWVARPRGP